MATGISSTRTTQALLVIFLVMSALTTWQAWDNRQSLEQTRAENSRLGQSLDDTREEQRLSREQAALLADQVKNLGARPVVTPDEIDTLRGEPGRTPSATEVAYAVTSYCSSGKCDGKNPTTGQVASAVTTYCSANGECRGPDGTNGETGKSGSDGINGTNGVDGAAGPKGDKGDKGDPPTLEQVMSAVETYCANNACVTGPEGPAGPQGEPGADTFPFSFSLEIPLPDGKSQMYVCRVPSSGTTGSCALA